MPRRPLLRPQPQGDDSGHARDRRARIDYQGAHDDDIDRKTLGRSERAHRGLIAIYTHIKIVRNFPVFDSYMFSNIVISDPVK